MRWRRRSCAGSGCWRAVSGVSLATRPFAGLADLTFAPRDGRTRLVASQTRPPLLAGRVLYPDEALPDLAHLILANPTAGIFAGDHLHIRVRVRAGGRAHVTTQAATRVHAMLTGVATQRIGLLVEEDAALEWLPDPTIPFRGARFTSGTQIVVAPGGMLIYGDILTPGRVASGERLAYTRLTTRLTVKRPAGEPLYREATSSVPARRPPLGRGLLGERAATSGTLLIVSDISPKVLCETIRAALVEEVGEQSGVLAGVSILPGGGGVCVKALAPDVASVAANLRVAWGVARSQLWNAPLPQQRKY